MNKHPYTYTILRYVHDTSTGEFANVGIILSSPEARYATAILRPTYGRLSKMFPGFDGEHFRTVVRHLQSRFDEIANRVQQEMDLGQKPVNAQEMAFAVIAPDDSSFQWSPMGSGLASDLAATAESIYERMVERYDDQQKNMSRSDEAVWKTFKKGLEERQILSRFGTKIIAVQEDEVEFSHAWKNSDRQNARIEHDKALKRVITALFTDDAQLFKQFQDNDSFRRWLTDTVFGMTYEE